MTDTARYADVVLPATTFLEGYDIARGYGPISLRLGSPVIEAGRRVALERRRLRRAAAARSTCEQDDDPIGELEEMLDVLAQLPGTIGDELREQRRRACRRSSGRPVQFGNVLPRTRRRQGAISSRRISMPRRPAGLYGYQPDPATVEYPLALISPASERSISSTLAELPRPEVRLLMHPDDAAARGLADGDAVRVFNELGEVRCPLQVGAWIRPRHRLAAEGALAQAHRQRLHGQRAGAGHADRSRRRRLLQRRPRAGRAVPRRRAARVPLVAEEEDQVEAAAFDAAERHALRAADVSAAVRLQAQEVGDLILEDELGRLRVAERLADAEEQLLADLLADASGSARRRLALRLDLELVELERVADRACQARTSGSRRPARRRAAPAMTCCPSPSSLIGWLKTISERMSA